MFSLIEYSLLIVTGKLPVTNTTNPVGSTPGAFLCRAAGSQYLSVVRNGLFEAFLRKMIMWVLKSNSSLSPKTFFPVQQMMEWSQAYDLQYNMSWQKTTLRYECLFYDCLGPSCGLSTMDRIFQTGVNREVHYTLNLSVFSS